MRALTSHSERLTEEHNELYFEWVVIVKARHVPWDLDLTNWSPEPLLLFSSSKKKNSCG